MDSQKMKSFKAHALLGASNSSRWLNCPPSAIAESKKGEQTSSAMAQEGSLAHAFGAELLKETLGHDTSSEREEINTLIASGVRPDGEMLEYVAGYSNYVMERLAEAGEEAELDIEQRLDYSEWVPDGYGTGDAIIVGPGILEVIDLKYGKGVEVSAEGNTQMMLYALGALAIYDCMYDLPKVRMTIYQPRLGNISSSEIETARLREWAEDVLKPMALLAAKGNGYRRSGAWCKFCKVKGECAQYADQSLNTWSLAQHADTLGTPEYSRLLPLIPQIREWATAVEETGLSKALGGEAIPGFKIVEGRSNRKITDPERLAAKLREAGFDEADFYEPKKLLGITALERLCGKKTFGTLSAGYIEKPQGKPTLVVESDKRQALDPRKEFEGINVEGE